jgi:hypothetical protein
MAASPHVSERASKIHRALKNHDLYYTEPGLTHVQGNRLLAALTKEQTKLTLHYSFVCSMTMPLFVSDYAFLCF